MRSVRPVVVALTTAILGWPGFSAMAGPVAAGSVASSVASYADNAAGGVAATAVALATAGAADGANASAGASASVSAKPGIFGATARAVSSDKLDGVRGGAETVVNDMTLHGTVADNAAINVRSGSNAIADGSFANSAGLPTVIQNTGSNVLIQNATILNVQFKQ